MKPEQITAWALDEASAEERQQLEAVLLENPNDKQKADETKAFCDFLLAELRDDSLALTETQRNKLKAQPVARSSRPPATSTSLAPQTKWRMQVLVRLAVAACVALGGFWTWQMFEKKPLAESMSIVAEEQYKVQALRPSEQSRKVSVQAPAQVAVVAEQPAAQKMPPAAPVNDADLQLLKNKSRAEGSAQQADERAALYKKLVTEAYKLQTEARDPKMTLAQRKQRAAELAEKVKTLSAMVSDLKAATEPEPPARPLTLNKTQRAMTPGDVAALKRIQDQQAYGLNFGDATLPAAVLSDTPTTLAATLDDISATSGAMVKAGTGMTTLSSANTFTGSTTVNAGTLVFNNSEGFGTRGGIVADEPLPAALGSSTITSIITDLNGKSQPVDLLGDATITTKSGTINSLTANVGSLGTGGTAVGSDAPATFNSKASQPGLVAGSGGIVNAGAANWTLSGVNTYTGGNTISAGDTTTFSGTLSSGRDRTAAPVTGYLAFANGGKDNFSTYTRTSSAVPASAPVALGITTGSAASAPSASSPPMTTLTLASATSSAPPATKPVAVMGANNTLESEGRANAPLIGGWATMDKDSKTDAFYFGGRQVRAEESESLRRTSSSNESYTRIIENEMKEVAREPLSTLSIDVDTASYANVRRFLNQNMLPPPDAVRIEELVNYFPTTEEGPAHDAKEPFGVRIELAPCPWEPVHRLARIAIKGREMDKERKASNLVFLVDVSGSMNEPAKLPLVQQSLRMLTEQLGEGDHVTMVVYAGSSGVVLPPTGGEKKAEILAAIDKLSAGGSTHGSAGIKLAYEQAVAGFIKGGVNRVILCTDGDFNVGVSSPEELEKLIKHKAKSGVFLSVLGFGSGNLKDRTMETLADKGNGNYAYIDSLSEARKVLVEQMSGTLVTIAKDVKIQVEFNPAAVRSYRLIGYENRLLAKEDFNDDTKDAGEIGAGHSVVALYEVVPANLPPGAEPRPAVDQLKYQAPAISPAQLAEAAKSGEMMTVKLRYKEPESSLSKLIEMPTKDEGKTLTASSEEFKFSAAVAGFGLLLRDSSYKGTLSWETVRRLALDGKGSDKLGYRGEFLQLIDKARGLK